jgi:hypothetical protein
MGQALDIKGFKFTQRMNGSRNIKNLKVETSMDGSSWTAIAGSPLLLQKINGEQSFLLPSVIKCKYFRLTVQSTSDVWDGTRYASLAEADVIKP